MSYKQQPIDVVLLPLKQTVMLQPFLYKRIV